jgi:hypothetical protein
LTAVKGDVSPPPGFEKKPAFKKKAIVAAPPGLKRKATVITRKEKHQAVARRKEKKALPATKMCYHCFKGGARTCCLWLRAKVNCAKVGDSSSTHGQVMHTL